MRVALALLADGANVTREGKLNLLGIFDTIFARGFPVTHPLMQLVLRFEAEPAEAGTRRDVEVQFLAPDGRPLFRLPGAVGVQQRTVGDTVRIDQIVTLTNVQLEQAGRYRFEVRVEGATAATVPLHVEQITTAH
jgi:uncharacterized protein DUF6941